MLIFLRNLPIIDVPVTVTFQANCENIQNCFRMSFKITYFCDKYFILLFLVLIIIGENIVRRLAHPDCVNIVLDEQVYTRR